MLCRGIWSTLTLDQYFFNCLTLPRLSCRNYFHMSAMIKKCALSTFQMSGKLSLTVCSVNNTHFIKNILYTKISNRMRNTNRINMRHQDIKKNMFSAKRQNTNTTRCLSDLGIYIIMHVAKVPAFFYQNARARNCENNIPQNKLKNKIK